MAKDFRFSVSVRFVKSRAALVELVKRAEDGGFDVICVPDHLGAAAPFPTLTAAAMVTTKLRLSMYVLNAAFYKPALLSRDIHALDVLSEGRVEVGLGTGYVREEFDAAELPYPSAGRRVDYLEHMTTYLKEHHPTTPILIAGNGDRVMTLAARQANIIGLTGSRVHEADDPLAERIEFVRNAAGDRFDSTGAEPGDHGGAARRLDHAGPVHDPQVRIGPVRCGDAGADLGAQRLTTRNGRSVVRLPGPVRRHLLHRAGQPHRQFCEGDRGAAVTGHRGTS